MKKQNHMKKKIMIRILFALLGFLPLSINAQGWQQLFTENGRGEAVIQTQDGNLVFLGEEGEYLKLVKTDLNGGEIWTKFLLLFDDPQGNDLVELPTGELLITGEFQPDNLDKLFVLRLDADGNQISLNEYGDPSDEGVRIFQDANGDLLVAGHVNNAGSGTGLDFSAWKISPAGTQIWQAEYGTAVGDRVSDALLLPDGGLILAGYANNIGDNDELLLVRIDMDGNETWTQTFVEPGFESRNPVICPTADGNFFIASQTPGQFNQADIKVRKMDLDGNEIWSQTYVIPDMQDPNAIELTADGGFIVAGRTNATGADVLLLKGDADGNLEFEKRISVGQLDWAEGIAVLTDGGYAFCGRGNQSFTRMFIGRTDSQGSVFSNFISGRLVLDSDDDCVLDATPNGQPWKVELNGATQDFSTFANADGEFEILADTGVYEVVITPLWPTNPSTVALCQPVADLNLTNFYETTALGDLIFETVQGPTEIISGYVFYDANGNCEFDSGEMPVECVTVPYAVEGSFETSYFGVTDENGYYEVAVPIQDWYYPGEFWWNTFYNCSLGTCTIDGAYVDVGNTFTQDIALQCGPDIGVVSGTVFLDENNDCNFDITSEEPLYAWQVLLINTVTEDSIFENTFSNGGYNFLVTPGTYEVQVLLPNATWQACTNPHTVTVDEGCHTGFDFPIQAAEICPLLEVDVSTNALRPCFQSNYYVQYCNLGSETATDAYIEVTLDSAMEFVSSPYPVTQMGQVLTFDIGDVEPLDCQTIDFKIFLDCDAETGLTHCVEAHIFPDTTCVPLNPLWDLSSVQLSGKCEGDSVNFIIKNVGTGDMSQTLNYIVIEDNVLIRSEPFQLPSGEDSTFVFYPDGATLRMEAEQSAFHPGNSMPSIALEGCGTNANGGISTGFVIQMPENDLDPFVSIECLESVNSFDPNDKQGFPKGVGEGHFIRPNTELEYKIRFQNTGTAPAVNVVIRDTLSGFLDAENLRPGVSSHAYEFELENDNVAVFTFEGINLPDSTANLEESMGFVKFRIPQTTDNQPGTQIFNSAAIYFDFNPPIITNETEHQIPFPVEEQFFAPEICLGEEWMGFEITGDTTLSETIEYAFFVEETTYEVTALGHSFFEQNITLIEGQMFNEIVINSDTTIIENLTAANGCDSTATTNITVLPNSVSEGIAGLSANVFPNPASGVFYVEMDLAEGMEMSLCLTDALGRIVSQITDHQHFAAGENRVKVETANLPTGIYHLHLRSRNGVWTGKVNLR